MPAPQREALYRNIRAAAESGWDFSSRWMRDPKDLRTLETTDLVPVDLNSLLYHAERTIAADVGAAAHRGDAEVAVATTRSPSARRAALAAPRTIPRVAFSTTCAGARASACSIVRRSRRRRRSTSASRRRSRDARWRASRARLLRTPGGFVTTLIRSGQQWDAPNGWPPLQWLTIEGVRRYERAELADSARARWLALESSHVRATGKMTEKYDVMDLSRPAGGGEYPTQDGFGWTNGVALALSVEQSSEQAPRAPTSLSSLRGVAGRVSCGR